MWSTLKYLWGYKDFRVLLLANIVIWGVALLLVIGNM